MELSISLGVEAEAILLILENEAANRRCYEVDGEFDGVMLGTSMSEWIYLVSW
jgi:hypothetical protein